MLHVVSKDVKTQNVSTDIFYLKILQQELPTSPVKLTAGEIG